MTDTIDERLAKLNEKLKLQRNKPLNHSKRINSTRMLFHSIDNCMICKEEFKYLKDKHEDYKNGVICTRCLRGLNWFHRNKEIIESAAKYLENH